MITTKPFFHAPYGSVLLTSNMVFYYFTTIFLHSFVKNQQVEI